MYINIVSSSVKNRHTRLSHLSSIPCDDVSLRDSTCSDAINTWTLNLRAEFLWNPYGAKAEADERSFFSEASGSARGLGMDSSLDSTWRLMPSQISSYPISKESSGSLLQSNYPQLHPIQDIGQVTISSLPKPQQQQHLFFGSEFGSSEPVKQHEAQSLRPFFDEWPKTRDSWSDLEDDRSNRTSFSTTQLSMSIPLDSSDFSTTSSRSPNDD